MNLATKFAGCDTAPLFDAIAALPLADGPGGRMPRPEPRVRRVMCAASDAHLADLVDRAGHLVWRRHEAHTIGGAHWTCSASDVRLCEAPAIHTHANTPTCTCLTEGDPQ